MVKVSLWVWAQVTVWLVLAVLTSVSPAPPKGDVGKRGSPIPPMTASPPSAPRDDDADDSYDYEYGYSSVQLLFAADSAPRKIQKPCQPGYKPRKGKCRRVSSIEGR